MKDSLKYETRILKQDFAKLKTRVTGCVDVAAGSLAFFIILQFFKTCLIFILQFRVFLC